MKNIGVYQFTNMVNGKIYIGSSKNIDVRYNHHINQLNKSNHSNKHLQAAWNKYGADSFKFDILELCCLEDLMDLEQQYLDATECYKNDKGYNILKTAKVYSQTEVTKTKIGTANKGKDPWIKGKHHTESARKKIRESNSGINNHMYEKFGELHHFYGKKHKEESKNKMRVAKVGKLNNKSSKPVVQYYNNIEINKFPSAAQAERDTGINAKNIAACLKNKRSLAGGYGWKYERIS